MYRAKESFATKNYDIKAKQILPEDFTTQEEIEDFLRIGYIEVYDGSLEITENGTYDVKDYETADVNVSGGGSTLQNDKEVTVTSNGSTTINPDEGYDGLKKVSLTTNVQPNLESKEVTITANTTTNITPTQGKDGLSSVSVITNIPSPSGTINISANGTYNVTNYASAEVSVGGQPAKGVVFSDYDERGYPHTVSSVGFYGTSLSTGIPNGYFAFSTSGYNTYLNKIIFNNELLYISDSCCQNMSAITEVSMPDTITSIGYRSFRNCSNLVLNALPTSLTNLDTGTFQSCSKLAISTIPDGVTTFGASCFQGCTSIKKISMSNIRIISGSDTSSGTFQGCTGLKQVWIGSAITNGRFDRYSFSGCSNLVKMYIDLPRATVEALPNYQYAFMNDTSKTGIIVCNDDPGFIDKATFDAQVIS